MQKEFTEDQEQFREVVARFLQDKADPAAARELLATQTGFDANVWHQMATEVGLTGTHIPETYGGFGFGVVELGIALEEMGRHIYCGPFFASSVMAGYGLMIAGDENAKQTWLPEIATGEVIATLVLDNLNSPGGVGRVLSAADNKVNGDVSLVVDGQNASQLFVVAGEADGLGLYRVEAGASGLAVTAIDSLDPTRRLAAVSFSDVSAERVGDVSEAALNAIWDHICVALSHEMIGGAQQLLDSTVEYTRIRYQFGRPIGSFQGLKHRLADLLMELEFAKAATHHAGFCLAAGDGDAYTPSMVKAMASDVYLKAAKEAIQMRGGIGFTWEEDTHFWFKRAKSSEVFMGTPSFHRERMMTMMEGAA